MPLPAARAEPFGPHLPGLFEDPYPTYRRYRESDPVHWAGAGPPETGRGAWYLFRHADAVAALKDPAFGRRPEGYLPGGPLGATMGRWLVFRNPPDHGRIRSALQRGFGAAAVKRLGEDASQLADRLVADAAPGERIDLIERLASPLPLLTVARLLGVPTDDLDRFRRWSHGLAPCLDMVSGPEEWRRAAAAAAEMGAFLAMAVGERRRGRGDDLLSALVEDSEAGHLSEEELVANGVFLLAAGHETTMQVLATGVRALLTEPGAWEALRADRALVPLAVEELLRWEAPVQITFRDVLAPTAIGGVGLAPGSQVAVMLGAANRDPERFPDPDRLDVGRAEARAHLSFASGPHYCVGATLARLEIAAGLHALLDRWPGLVLDGEPRRRRGLLLRGLETLPVRLGT